MSPSLDIHLLGDFLLLADGEAVVSFNVPRLQALLTYLLLHRDAPQSRQRLAFLLWPDSNEAQARANLRKLLHQLHQALPAAEQFLRSDTQTVQWHSASSFTLDVAAFEDALAQAERAKRGQDWAAEQQTLRRAVEVCRGELLPGCYDEWVLPERERLRAAFRIALERLVALLERGRDYDGAIAYAQRLLHDDPLHESAYRQLMRLHALKMDRPSALRIYHTCAAVLERELGVEPSEATRAAYAQLLNTADTQIASIEASPSLTTSPLFVGRTEEWARMVAVWQAAVSGSMRVCLIAGEAGVGKTRLAEELCGWVGRQGMLVAVARCYAAEERHAYAPVVSWLRSNTFHPILTQLDVIWLTEVARLLPELLVEHPGLPHPMPLTESWQRQRLLDALLHAVLGVRQPVLLFIDDIQWSDPETLEWLSYALRSDLQAPKLLVATLRSEALDTKPALRTWLAGLRRARQLDEIELGPLDVAETAQLLGGIVERLLTSEQASRVYAETEGNPLFIVEIARTGILDHLDGSQDIGDTEESSFSLPPTMQSVITERLNLLSPTARDLLAVAATIGRAFTVGVLSRAAACDEDALVRGLDELWRRRIVRELGGDDYDFSHDKIREVAYSELSGVRRRLLHRRVAEAIEQEHGGDTEVVSGQIAVHYERAGLLDHAVAAYERAADFSRRVYANAEAIGYYQRALALIESHSSGATHREAQSDAAAQLHEHIGNVLKLIGQHDDAREAYSSALTVISKHHHSQATRLHRQIGETLVAQHRYDEATGSFEMAEAILEQAPEKTAPWWQEWIWIQISRVNIQYYEGHVAEMAALAERIHPMVVRYGTAAQRIRFFQCLFLANIRQHRFVITDDALNYALAAFEASQETDNLNQLADMRFDIGFSYLWRGDLDAAEEQLRFALSLAERTGDSRLRTLCLAYLVVVNRRRGQVETTHRSAMRALEVAKRTQSPLYIALSEANLAWVAWHEQECNETLAHGRTALIIWAQLPNKYPFQWAALWPLIAVAIDQHQVGQAIEYAQLLLDPSQQRLPEALEVMLERAIQAWTSGDNTAAHSDLHRSIEIAYETRYL